MKHSFWLLPYIHTITLSSIQTISTYLLHLHMYMVRSLFFPLVPLAPLAPLASHCSLFTYLAPSSCDRNRPSPSQVNCKLTLFAPPFSPIVPPLPFPWTPTVQRLITTTLGPIRSSIRNNNPHTSTYLAPSSCDRNRPPRSQVVCKLLPLVPHCSLVSSPPKSQPFLGFPRTQCA